MRLRTDCNLWNLPDGYYIKSEGKSIFLGDLSENQICALSRARETSMFLHEYLDKDIVNKLLDANVLLHEDEDEDEDEDGGDINDLEKAQSKWFRYHGKTFDEWKNFKNLKIGVLGCGGVGALACQSLAAAGINNFILIDGDVIGRSNLNRQFTYHNQDIGKYKTDILKEKLEGDYHGVNIIERKIFIENASQLINHFSKVDVLLCCADKPANTIQKICADFSNQTGIPIIFGSVGFMNGSLGPFIVNRSYASKYMRVCEIMENHQKKSVWELDHASNGATNSIIANMVASEVLLYFISKKECTSINKCLNVNFNSLETKVLYSIK